MATSEHGPGAPSDAVRASLRRYWRANLFVMIALLALWAIVSLGCGVLWAEPLNNAYAIGGVPLGFWFAQQGSILVFVLLIVVYAAAMNRLDRIHAAELERLREAQSAGEGR